MTWPVKLPSKLLERRVTLPGGVLLAMLGLVAGGTTVNAAKNGFPPPTPDQIRLIARDAAGAVVEQTADRIRTERAHELAHYSKREELQKELSPMRERLGRIEQKLDDAIELIKEQR